MYLKSIRAYGFKSFADKTDLEIKQGITGIVGPNGSGKSNVVDAVKWVLGEQSIKALRGSEKMTDVIFAGSKSRDAQTRAMVSLTFDNTDHYLNSEFNELEIKRVVYKTGENEYYINNSKVRLKDITDLFIDSGAGKESFNIISQGAVSDIINSKPEERRAIFEEAAGVLKYKKRKQESVRKLEKTNENLEKIELLVNEIKTTIEPLKEQSIAAKKYLELKEKLENIEIALIANDISRINEEYNKIKTDKDIINEELLNMSVNTSEWTSKTEHLKLKSIKYDEEISALSDKLIKISNEIAELNSAKQVATERKKYEVEDIKLQNNLVSLKEQELSLKNEISQIDKDLEILVKNLEEKTTKTKEIEEELEKYQNEKRKNDNELSKLNFEIIEIKNKIKIIENNIENDAKIPYAVKSILNNPRLLGIHNIIGKLIDTKQEYVLAIDTTLGSNANVIVVENEISAKNSISYLKENKLGRATFFPLNIIKGRTIDEETLSKIKDLNSFIDIASNLVTYDNKYKEIIDNQLGNVIVAKNIDGLNEIGKIINYKYKIVTLDGDIQFAGGSITGGSVKNNSSALNEKFELEALNQKLLNVENDHIKTEMAINDINNIISKTEENKNLIEKDIWGLQEQINNKNRTLENAKQNYNTTLDEISGMEGIQQNNIDDELEKILNEYYNKVNEKELISKDLVILKQQKSDLTNEISLLELEYHKTNSEYNKKQNELKNYEIKLGRMDVKLDNLLLTLNENYNITYEKASEMYELDIEEESARLTVNRIKADIKDLGNVNIGAIDEYDRLNERYTFLETQKSDLETSINSLLNVINEMDEIMKDKFSETFEQIKNEFHNVFKTLFKGGEGILKLTDESNILETGIDIIAQPPGKKLNSIILLSGGEKTLTAIALLFAILNVKPVPFIILDEVEAALDEANVDAFGKYLQNKKDKSQFIIITHKKRTMEYADVLYGITMQESGVSKLVSVELDQ